MIKTRIVVRFQFEAVHYWPNAPQGLDERYLALPHRHMFHVEATTPVAHEDRDIEIIAFKREMQAYCADVFGKQPTTSSCETMARMLLEHFRLYRCQVLEDNENGAEVEV